MLLLFSFASAAPVLVSPSLPGNAQAPDWSPDGTRLAWEQNDHDKQTVDLYVATPGLPGGPRHVVAQARGSSAVTAGFSTSGAGATVTHELSWSPASLARFVYSANGLGNDYDLYLDTSVPLASAPGADGGPAWSPDGRHIAFTSARSGDGDLYLLDTSAPTSAPLRLSGDTRYTELWPTWAPDGKGLAFVGHTTTGDNLYLIDNVDFPAPRQLTAWPHTQTRPTFSPDGTMLAFYSDHTQPGRFDLYVTALTGTPTLVATDVLLDAHGPAWTPDSRDVVFVKNDSNHFAPVWAAPVAAPATARALDTGTVGNVDLDLVRRADGQVWLALAAQGRTDDAVRDYTHIYVMVLPALP